MGHATVFTGLLPVMMGIEGKEKWLSLFVLLSYVAIGHVGSSFEFQVDINS